MEVKDYLPKKMNKGKECIDWKNSAGYKVHFIYDDIEGELEILNYIVYWISSNDVHIN